VLADQMQIRIEKNDDSTTIRLGGTLDYGVIHEFQELLTPLLEECRPHIVLDLTQLTYLDSAGLNELLCLNRRIAKAQGEWVILVTSERPRRTTHMKQLLAYLPIKELDG
jgi:anti-sigma B factor antagonist